MTCDQLTDELLTSNEPARLRELIFLAEDTDFTEEESGDLSPRLFDIALRLRDGNDPLDTPVVWSAIRTGASMLRPEEAERLLPLLEQGHPVETSRVTLKMLGRIFEAQPPKAVDQYARLADAVCEIANPLLNHYTITSSRSAAVMVQLATYALAAMASKDTLRVAEEIRKLCVPWFMQQTCRDLRELRKHWSSRPKPVELHLLLNRVLGVLGGSCGPD